MGEKHSMTTLNELYYIEHWKYRAEGNANLVLEYIGPDPRFKTTLLRLRKVDRQTQNSAQVPDPTHELNKKDISTESFFASEVVGLLLGQEFVEQLIALELPTDFLKSLAAAIDPFRPESRLHKSIDCSQTVGFLALDHTRFIGPSANSSASVEIKPKWGFLTTSAFIRKEQSIKRRRCRFCMYQHRKLKSGQEESLSQYCPIDLFSGKDTLVEDSLNALVKTPQNNLRLFVNGTQKTISSEEISQCLYGLNVVDIPRVHTLPDDEDSYQTASLTDVLTEILIQSPLLRRLGRLQQGLDSLDVETIHRFYVQLADPITGALPDPTVQEYLNAAEAFLYRTDMNDMMAKDHETFMSNNAASLGFGPEDDLDDEDVVPRDLKLHYIHEFLLSATLKDCSILITVRQADIADKNKEEEAERSLPKSNVIKQGDIVEGSSLGFRENCHRINVNDKEFVYKITCIDLDPKKMSSVPMYLKKDRDIVNHYLSTIGEHESSCGSQ
ncbi:Inositol-pentakisphosphate 2-kinase [Mortierella sp. AD094]|nr:Inositol-pentakisphosphate 2-kinase [Mortierella sp. AD094]